VSASVCASVRCVGAVHPTECQDPTVQNHHRPGTLPALADEQKGTDADHEYRHGGQNDADDERDVIALRTRRVSARAEAEAVQERLPALQKLIEPVHPRRKRVVHLQYERVQECLVPEQISRPFEVERPDDVPKDVDQVWRKDGQLARLSKVLPERRNVDAQIAIRVEGIPAGRGIEVSVSERRPANRRAPRTTHVRASSTLPSLEVVFVYTLMSPLPISST